MRTAFRPKSLRLVLLAGLAICVVAPASVQAQTSVLRLKNQPQTARAGGAAIKLYDGRVLVAAGGTSDGSTNSYDIFDPSGDSGAGSWTHHVGMNGGVYNVANGWWHSYMFNLGGPHHKVLLIGKEGPGTDAGARQMSQVYDPVDDTWTAPVHTGRNWTMGCAQSTDGVVACSVNGISVYKPDTDSWDQLSIDSGWWPSSIAGLDNGKFLVVTNNSYPNYNNAYVLDTNDNSWTATGGAPFTLIDATMFQLPNKKVLSVGGSTDSNNVNVSNTYLWDPETGQWSNAGYVTGTETPQALGFWGASQDSAGNVYYASTAVSLAKFDATTGQWDPSVYHQAGYNDLFDAQDPRATDRAVPVTLNDGRTLVFGGGGNWAGTAVYTVGNVPVVTAQPVLDVSNVSIGDTATVTADATWDTVGLVINKRWQLCTDSNGSTCVDFAGNSGSSYTFTVDNFKAGYRYLRRVETVQDATLGPIEASTFVQVQGPAAPAADPQPSVNFDSSGEYVAGTVLTRTQGTWTGSNLSPIVRNWVRCSGATGTWTCDDLGDADTYTITQEDIDNNVQITYAEHATDEYGQTTDRSQSGSIAPVSPPNANCCVDLAFPSSNRSDNVPPGETLTLDPSALSWNHNPDSVEYKWQRYDQDLGDWVDIDGATAATLSTVGFTPSEQLKVLVRGTKAGLAGQWNQVANIYVDGNMWTPNGKFNWDTGNSRCTQTESLADLRTQGDCGDQISDARYYTSNGNHGDAYDGAYSTWIAKDSGNGDGTVYAQTLVDQGPNNELAWKKAGDFGTDWWTSGAFGSDDEIDGVKIGVRFRPSATLDLVAKVVKLTNTTSDPVTRVIAETLNFGSDSDTTIHGQSSGGSETLDPAARWFVTADSSVGDNEPSDPVNTTVFGGPDAAVSPTTGQSEDDLGATFEVTIPAGETRYLVYFMGLGSMLQPATNDPSVAVTNAQSLFANYQSLPSDLLVDVPVGDRGKILNWSTVPPVVAPRVSFKGWANSASGVAKLAVFGAPGAQIEVSNLANFKNSTSVAVGRWVSFKTLAKKLGVGQVKVYFREKGKPESASSIDLKYDFYRPFISRNSVRWAKTAKATWNVHILANDKTCPGCDPKLMVQLAYGKTKPAVEDPFPTVLSRDVFSYRAYFTIKSPTPPRWVRVADSQGNMSDWRPLVGSPAFPAG